jgi:hypothetical protein
MSKIERERAVNGFPSELEKSQSGVDTAVDGLFERHIELQPAQFEFDRHLPDGTEAQEKSAVVSIDQVPGISPEQRSILRQREKRMGIEEDLHE